MSKRTLLLAGAAVATTALVVYALRRRKGAAALDVDEETAPVSVTTSQPQAQAAAVEVEESPAAARRSEAQHAKDRGNKRFQGKQYKQAIEEYTKAIELLAEEPQNKNLSVYYGNRAQCYYLLEEHERALSDCNASIEVDPKYIKALVRRGTVQEKLRNLEQSLVDFTAAGLLSQMTNESAVKGCERVVKDIAAAKAQERLAKPIRGLPSPNFIAMFVCSFRSIRGLMDQQYRKPEEVAGELSGASGVGLGQLLSEQALAFMKLNRFEDAMEVWKKVAELVPWNANDPLIAEWRAASTKPAHVEPGMALTMLAMFTHLQGRHDEAMSLYNRALELSPDLVETMAMRASLFYEKQQLEKAYEDFEKAVKVDSSHPDLYCHRGQLHLLQNQFSQAVSDLREAVRLDPSSILAQVHLGMALARNNQQSEALAEFDKAAAQFPKSPDVLNYYGELLIELGKIDEAASKVDKAIKLSGGKFALAFVNQAVLKMTTQDLEGAKSLLQKAIEADPLCETAHVHIAHLHIQSRDLQAAVDSYDAAIQLLRVPQELTECCAMREAVVAQQHLLTTQGEIYGPVMEQFRQMQQQMQAQMMMQQQ